MGLFCSFSLYIAIGFPYHEVANTLTGARIGDRRALQFRNGRITKGAIWLILG
jgi:hypothetical protein